MRERNKNIYKKKKENVEIQVMSVWRRTLGYTTLSVISCSLFSANRRVNPYRDVTRERAT